MRSRAREGRYNVRANKKAKPIPEADVYQLGWAVLVIWIYASSFCLAVAQAPAKEQTLSKQLAAEGATSLARAARKHGSSIRGAILFPQKQLTCATCHAPGSQDLGPNLTQIGKDVTDEHFVESILQPSKVITKGFESVKILTESGEVVVGRIVTDDDAELVLRDPAEAKKLIRLDRKDIEQISPNQKSTMPDGLADQLEDRQQFLDLVKYLMDIAATSGPSSLSRASPLNERPFE
jgi:putative heme-binding domain-containing protein